jgi:phage recombination protein Bet
MSDTMNSAPIIDEVDKRRLDLIRKTVAKGCTDAEIASFLELAARYDLDPFAHEIWCAKDKGGRLLLMVGRDGLRKIALRQGLYIDGDVVRAKDEFAVRRTEHGRVVHHAYGLPEERGEIVGAWCDVTDTAGRSVGYFYAPLSEYKPRNASEYSPWSKQTSTMILAAAERQALRQATPLGGLLAEGEDESARAQLTTGQGDGSEPGWGDTSVESAAAVEAIIARAQALGHAGLSDRATAQMTLSGQPDSVVAMWCERAGRELDEFEGKQTESWSAAGEPQSPEALREQLGQVLDRIAAEEEAGADEAVMADLYAEQERLERLLGDEPGDEGQETMPL